jgi:hypothetical protein
MQPETRIKKELRNNVKVLVEDSSAIAHQYAHRRFTQILWIILMLEDASKDSTIEFTFLLAGIALYGKLAVEGKQQNYSSIIGYTLLITEDRSLIYFISLQIAKWLCSSRVSLENIPSSKN